MNRLTRALALAAGMITAPVIANSQAEQVADTAVVYIHVDTSMNNGGVALSTTQVPVKNVSACLAQAAIASATSSRTVASVSCLKDGVVVAAQACVLRKDGTKSCTPITF